MKSRNRISDSRYYGVTEELRPVIKISHKDLDGALGWTLDYPSFEMGYICGMKNPNFETVKKSLEVMKRYGDLNKKEQEIVMLVIDGMKARYEI